MAWKGWADWVPPHERAPEAAPAAKKTSTPAAARKGDRGTRRGAQRFIVTAERQLVEHRAAKNAGVTGTFFQSKREALTWIARLEQQDRGEIRALRRQVPFALQVRNPSGLLETVTRYVADFVFEERVQTASGPTWAWVIEDVKPAGGLREDAYLLKKKWFEAQYGLTIRESH